MTSASGFGDAQFRNGATRDALSYVSRNGAGGGRSRHDFLVQTKKLALFTNIRLTNHIDAEDENLFPGASGTIVKVLADGKAYIVEFFEPRHCVVTVHDRDLSSDRPADALQ